MQMESPGQCVHLVEKADVRPREFGEVSFCYRYVLATSFRLQVPLAELRHNVAHAIFEIAFPFDEGVRHCEQAGREEQAQTEQLRRNRKGCCTEARLRSHATSAS
jgi:hypothetical protein